MQTIREYLRAALRDDAGEGVISTGIIVLIMALLGAAMWVAFDGILETAQENTEAEIESINNG